MRVGSGGNRDAVHCPGCGHYLGRLRPADGASAEYPCRWCRSSVEVLVTVAVGVLVVAVTLRRRPVVG